MGDKGYRGQLGIVVPASKKAKVSREVQQLEDEKQRGHELQAERAAIECMNKRVKEWAVVRTAWKGRRDPVEFFGLGAAGCVRVDQCYPLRSSFVDSRSSPCRRRVCIINPHRAARSQTEVPETVSSVL